MKSKILILLILFSFIILAVRYNVDRENDIGVSSTLTYFKEGVSAFVIASKDLNTSLKEINGDTLSIIKARHSLKNCRLKFKEIEFFTSYFFPSETRFYNMAPKFEVEEPTLELVEPMGLQQIETLLFDDNILLNRALLISHSDALTSSAEDLDALLYEFNPTDAQILESVRIELIRVSVLSISGYDAPMLKTGIAEAAASTNALIKVLTEYTDNNSKESPLQRLLVNSLSYLKRNQDFDSFNRLEYLTKFALPLQKQLGLLIRDLGLVLNTSKHLNYNAEHIYSKDAIQLWNGMGGDIADMEIKRTLGEKLFFDKSLSGNLKVSCSSCHEPQNYFTDLLAKSPAIIKDSVLKRNTPTLLYASRQHSQFWDGAAENLTQQIKAVILNPLEMGGNESNLSQTVFSNEEYKELFKSCFPDKSAAELGLNEISVAIASYVSELSPMNSAFDKYLKGDRKALASNQINGFNIFMGKAQCGTCHFPPFFNSLLPPFYDVSEVEILGTPKTADLNNPQVDNDLGRQHIYNIKFYKQSFKTPTVRNTARTGPYMHNGAFFSLNEVVEFYNKGGGKGIGLEVPEQTLSSTPLNLSEKEKRDLISFLEALTDSIDQSPKHAL